MPTGSCLCGAVRFEIPGPLARADACHCTACRKWTGHYLVDVEIKKADLQLQGADAITWYRSSEKVRRGFCGTCGSVLFWDPVHHDWMGVAMGALDKPTGTTMYRHIFTADKGDYYELTDGLPQHPQ